MGPGEVFGLAIVIGLPAAFLIYIVRSYFSFKEKQLEAETSMAAERPPNMPPATPSLRRGSEYWKRSSPMVV